MDIGLDDATTVFCDELAALDKEYREGLPLHQAVVLVNTCIRKSCVACATAESGTKEEVDALRAAFRARIAKWFNQSWFMNRALSKPRGYPGDYQILEAIYDHVINTQEGIGQVLDAYFLQTELARAVLGRKDKCRNMLQALVCQRSDSPVAILDIACGPCRELSDLGRNFFASEHMFHGLDYDQEALDYAKGKAVQSAIPEARIQFTKQNVLKMISAERNVAALGRFDLIYSVGLYDYLPDDLLVRVLVGTLAMLKENGRYVVAFKDCQRYDKTEYQWHVDWHFFQRTESECLSLLERTGAEIISTERDASGIILFFTIKGR